MVEPPSLDWMKQGMGRHFKGGPAGDSLVRIMPQWFIDAIDRKIEAIAEKRSEQGLADWFQDSFAGLPAPETMLVLMRKLAEERTELVTETGNWVRSRRVFGDWAKLRDEAADVAICAMLIADLTLLHTTDEEVAF